MKTNENGEIDPDVLADMQAVANAAESGVTLDPATIRRVRERSEKVQAELLERYGIREIAVALIREGRDEG